MSRVRAVLHRTIYPRNIGMCARSLANMGLDRLIIVAPRCELTDEAKQGAAHAQNILRNATIYPDLASFHQKEGDGLRIALSGKDFRLQKSEILNVTLEQLKNETLWKDSGTPIYLMFGPEDDGLSAEEMELCHHICRLPTYGEITSLNLSHAVLLTSYLVQAALGAQTDASVEDPIEGKPVFFPSESIHRWLDALGFDLSAPRISIEKTLNRILLSRNPTGDELRILNTVLQQTVRKLGIANRKSQS